MHPLPGTIYGICGGLLPISEEFQERVQQDAEKYMKKLFPLKELCRTPLNRERACGPVVEQKI